MRLSSAKIVTSMLSMIDRFNTVFWDFDGVIKESVPVKTEAFFQLFLRYGRDVAGRVREHHLKNGGMYRFEKIPIYLEWCGQAPTKRLVAENCDEFNRLSLQGVIDSPWVPGVEAYIRTNSHDQVFFIVSATPRAELGMILERLEIQDCFSGVFGAPTSKSSAIRTVLQTSGVSPNECLMIGDARSDLKAAHDNGVPFLLRRHVDNIDIFGEYTGDSIRDFCGL